MGTGYWDGLTSIALLFTATVTPYEVALLQPVFDPLFIVNRVVDGIFAIDVLVQFVSSLEDAWQEPAIQMSVARLRGGFAGCARLGRWARTSTCSTA